MLADHNTLAVSTARAYLSRGERRGSALICTPREKERRGRSFSCCPVACPLMRFVESLCYSRRVPKSLDNRELVAAIEELRAAIGEGLVSAKVLREGDQDRIDCLGQAVEELSEEVRGLREAIDEVRSLFEWALHHGAMAPEAIVRLVSMPADPAAEDWAERVNRYGPADLPPATDDGVEPPLVADKQGRLFT